MLDTTSDLISRLLRHTVTELDVPVSLREAATAEYKRVGNWLAAHADGSAGWVVHSQGSFLLNTVVLPSGSDEYDVDAVCRRSIVKASTTQAELKYEVGDVLRGFLITDRDLHEWQRSDPLAFAAWFKDQAEAEFVAKRLRLAEAARIPPQDIPAWEVKTTLHRVVQVIKLHRNEYFRSDLDSRPASILITTLAAHAYRGERELYDAVLQAVELMPQYVQESRDGLLVPNPVEPRENFADRWRHHPELAPRFFGWLQQLGEDLRDAESRRGLDKVATRLSESFGAQPVEKAVGRLGDTYRRARETGRLGFAATSGLLSTTGAIPVRNHDFYGDAARQ